MSCEVACRTVKHFTNRSCGESRRFGSFARPAFVPAAWLMPKRNPLAGSTDVSWVVPIVQVHAPTVAIGTPFHTWQVVAQGKTARTPYVNPLPDNVAPPLDMSLS
jgi:hypothetical protein